MADFLIFQLQGLMASWGDIAVGEYRPSLGHPSKSAISGLLAAALGIERTAENAHLELDQQYGVAVCVRASGELLRDYHTIQVPGGRREYASRRDELLTDKLKLNTILSQRDYFTDALYQVAIWCKGKDSPYSLEDLQKALKQPRFNLYLGRKSCPVGLPLFPEIISGAHLKQAFNEHDLEKSAGWTQTLITSDLISYFWEQGDLSEDDLGMTSTMTYPRRDQVRSRKRWQFSNRDEFYFAETVGGD